MRGVLGSNCESAGSTEFDYNLEVDFTANGQIHSLDVKIHNK